MRLPPGSSVTGAAAVGDINRTKAVASNAGSAPPPDDVRISKVFETFGNLNTQHTQKVANVTAAVQRGNYQVDSGAVGKSIVEDALL